MSAIYKSEEGQHLVESRYRDLLARWPVPSEQRTISTSFGDIRRVDRWHFKYRRERVPIFTADALRRLTGGCEPAARAA